MSKATRPASIDEIRACMTTRLPRLRTAAMAVANATGLEVTAVTLDGLHVVVDPNSPNAGVLHKGSLVSCDRFVAQETEKAFAAARQRHTGFDFGSG